MPLFSRIDENLKDLQEEKEFDYHYCEKYEQEYCFEHKQIALRINDQRIANIEEIRKYLELFRC